MIKRIKKHLSKSNIVQIKLNYNGEKIRFNLYEELKISDANLERELIDQPTYYSFCLLLHKKLLTEFERRKVERNRMWGRLFLLAKEKPGTNGRGMMNDEMCKAWVDAQPKYIAACEACIQAKDDADTIFAAVKGFEQRKDLMQTLASNQRAQRI